MSILLFAFIVVVLLCLAIYLIDTIPISNTRLKWALQAIAIVAAIVVIAQRAGFA